MACYTIVESRELYTELSTFCWHGLAYVHPVDNFLQLQAKENPALGGAVLGNVGQ